MVRLGGAPDPNYKRPEKTYQESLTTDQIKEKLKDYVKVDDLSKVPINSHVRYFIYQEDPQTHKAKRLFRLGGRLIKKDNHDKYVVLSNGKQSWSVNTSNSVFFRQLRTEEVHDKYEDKVNQLKQTIDILQRKLEESTLSEKPRSSRRKDIR